MSKVSFYKIQLQLYDYRDNEIIKKLGLEHMENVNKGIKNILKDIALGVEYSAPKDLNNNEIKDLKEQVFHYQEEISRLHNEIVSLKKQLEEKQIENNQLGNIAPKEFKANKEDNLETRTDNSSKKINSKLLISDSKLDI